MLRFFVKRVYLVHSQVTHQNRKAAMKVEIVVTSRDGKRVIKAIPGIQVGVTPTGLIKVMVGTKVKCVRPDTVRVV